MQTFRTTTTLLATILVGIYSTNAAATYGGSYSWSDGGNDYCYSNCSTSQTYEYSYDKGTDTSGNTYDKTVKITAWNNSGYGYKLEKKDLSYSNGKYGVKTSYNDTYVDNQDSNRRKMDSILYDYGDKCVVLDSVIIEKNNYNYDADIKVMAFIGDKNKFVGEGQKYGSFDDYLKDKTYDDLMNEKDEKGNNVWKSYDSENTQYGENYDSDGDGYADSKKKNFVGNYTDSEGNVKKDYTASSYWLVMADNSKKDNGYYKNDYFKVKHLGGYDFDKQSGGCHKVEVVCDTTVPPSEVPVPATAFLFGLGLPLLGFSRLRKKA